MNDRQFSFAYTRAGLLATFLGFIAFGAGVASFFVDNAGVGIFSIHFAIGSALFRVRSWLSRMSARERNAFELGQDAARVRSLR